MCQLCDIMKFAGEGPYDGKRPWANDPITIALPAWEEKRTKMENWMLENGLGDYVIDEIALQFNDRATMGNFVMDAVTGDGIKIFNHAFDHVKTHPFHTEYDVEYIFLEMPSTMRVEAMNILQGISPLHIAVGSHLRDSMPGVVHMSFKCSDLEDYTNVTAALDAAPEAHMVQGCDSTYGAFSYWNLLDQDGVYLKPRVNVRDVLHEHDEPDRGEFGMPGLGSNVLPFGEQPWERHPDGPEAFEDGDDK